MIFSREARTAGRKPPSIPMSRENPNDVAVIEGVIATSNA
jgi:hypothetical protein